MLNDCRLLDPDIGIPNLTNGITSVETPIKWNKCLIVYTQDKKQMKIYNFQEKVATTATHREINKFNS